MIQFEGSIKEFTPKLSKDGRVIAIKLETRYLEDEGVRQLYNLMDSDITIRLEERQVRTPMKASLQMSLDEALEAGGDLAAAALARRVMCARPAEVALSHWMNDAGSPLAPPEGHVQTSRYLCAEHAEAVKAALPERCLIGEDATAEGIAEHPCDFLVMPATATDAAEAEAEMECEHCHEVVGRAPVCAKCGATQSWALSEGDALADAQDAPEGEGESAPTGPEGPTAAQCHNCHAEVQPGDVRCSVCGASTRGNDVGQGSAAFELCICGHERMAHAGDAGVCVRCPCLGFQAVEKPKRGGRRPKPAPPAWEQEDAAVA